MRSWAWGGWVYHPEYGVLIHSATGFRMPLADVRSTADVRDLLFQLNREPWATPVVRRDFLAALRALFGPRSYAPDGEDRPLGLLPRPGSLPGWADSGAVEAP